jgi:hypothetical protein
MHKVVDATKDAGLGSILDPSAGRPIWRATREKLFQVLNQVGGGLGDYVLIQAAIDAKDPLVVIDGFGGSASYDLDEVDDAAGPIRERVYEIMKACLEPGSLLLPPLQAINALKELPLTQWIVEMEAIYFDISPEMGLQAQQPTGFSVLSTLGFVYHHFLLYFISTVYTSDLEFYKQFLENDGVPFRLQPSAYLAQFRIALTAKCEHFVDCIRSFDADTKETQRCPLHLRESRRQICHRLHADRKLEAQERNHGGLQSKT